MTNLLRWGVMGAAEIGRTQVIPALQTSATGTVVALASRDGAKAREYAQALNIPRVVPTYEALLADPEVDAIYLPLPNSLHAEWAIRAAQAGKAVLCEKPLAVTAQSAQAIVDAFDRYGSSLMEGFMYRFHPQHRRVRELIADGAVGAVREVRAHLSVNLMTPPDPANVRLQPALGGGALLDMGCYAVNVVRMIFGVEPTRAQASWIVDPRFDVDVAGTGILEFPDCCTASVSWSFIAGGQGNYTVIGTEGSIEVPRAILPGMGTRAPDALVVVVDADGKRREESFAPVNQYRLMAEAFASALLNKQPMPFAASDAVANMEVLDALAEAARSRCAQNIGAR
ncbi:Gfo/Idh/MocA family protein [Paraburkholderia tuberum]|uniref:Predicted dehydrogenase n=1 Tax=Paraburkholderia tuberum TaxID=157910 RepID=A0A1H1KI17_9BURK|nr:Gfo/Idh/MocA family oxidoreductase [Paraburkholderia tuberum]SDR61419.1 Predicted dehydrogenase [Paraburkholderia tuberum]